MSENPVEYSANTTETDEDYLRRVMMQMRVRIGEWRDDGSSSSAAQGLAVALSEIIESALALPRRNPQVIETLKAKIRDFNNRIDDAEFARLELVDVKKELRFTHEACSRWKDRALKAEGENERKGSLQKLGSRADGALGYLLSAKGRR